MRIRRITIRDFQIHKRLSIRLSRRVTSIAGPSDVGKSSVLRALRWLALNEPAGDEFIRWGAAKAKVVLETSRGIVVRRERGPQNNSYVLGDKRLRCFGTEVPSDVSALLRLEDLNFQGQYDSPFWFSETAGEVARGLNRLVNLEVIDWALKKVGVVVRTAESVVAVCRGQLKEIKGKLRRLAFVRQMMPEFRGLEETDRKLLERRERLDRLYYLLRGLDSLHKTRESITLILESWTGVEELKSKRDGLVERVAKLRRLLTVADRVSGLAVIGEMPSTIELEQAAGGARQLGAKVVRLGKLIEELRKTQTSKDSAEKEAKELRDKYKRLIGKECPLCGQAIR